MYAHVHAHTYENEREKERERERELVPSELEIERQISLQSVHFLESSKVLVILVILSKSHENIFNPFL